MRLGFTFLLVFAFTLAEAQDLSKVRKRLTELESYQAIRKMEDSTWSYEDFSKSIKSSNGSFSRQNPRPTSADIKTELLQEVFYFLRMNASNLPATEIREIKKLLYRTISWWLIDKPQFRWTDSALDQPRFVGAILLMLFDTMEQDQQDPDLEQLVKTIREQSANYLRYTWNFGKAEDRFLNHGEDLSVDVQRMGNVGYRLFAMTAISAALDNQGLMDEVDKIVKNQLTPQINTGKIHPTALMPDYAFHQHNRSGGQLYNLGYGLDWFNDFVGYSYYVKDSQWAFSQKDLGILVRFLKNGIYPFFLENGQLVDHGLGRHNQVKSSWVKFPESRAKLLRNYFPANSDEYLIIEGILADSGFRKKLGFQSFYSSDFLVADVAKYAASVRLVSDRTSGQESGDDGQKNGLENFFSSDGSFFHYLPDFDQYKGAWDWTKVPGTTSAALKHPLPYVAYGNSYGGFSSYAGTIHSENGGMLAGNLRRNSGTYQLEMVKSYILLEDVVVFWGFGLKYSGKEKVYTTLTQEKLEAGSFILNSEKKVSIGPGFSFSKTIEGVTGIWNNHTGYLVFPVSDKSVFLEVKSENKPTRWNQLDARNQGKEDQLPMLSASIQHTPSNNIKGDSYFYWMIPQVNEADFIKHFQAVLTDSEPLKLNQVSNSDASIFLVNENTAWFVNFKNAGRSSFSLGGYEISVSGLIGGMIQFNQGVFSFHLTQMEKRNNLGQDFSIAIDTFAPISLPSIVKLAQPLNQKSTTSGVQINGNTTPKSPLDFGSTFRFDISVPTQK